jgi:uncharacterized protein (TIGR03118 family)
LSNALLVGNNLGDNRINAFDPLTGQLLGQVRDGNGDAIEIDGLWGLQFGNGVTVGDTNTLIFSAGIDNETHGILGTLTVVPEPSGAALAAIVGIVLAGFRSGRRSSKLD